MKYITLTHSNAIIDGTINLVASKSESNRALIINALADGKGQLHNLANARDTRTMQRLLLSKAYELDVIDAGTTMRFLTAYMAVKGHACVLTGSARMQERPIKLLVEALTSLGAVITYTKNQGYPPIQIHRFEYTGNNEISIRGDVSSQYISALLMVAPCLPEGLKLTLTGKIASKPYIQMTLNLMQKFGISHQWAEQTIIIHQQSYTPCHYTIEADWSAASYWYSIVALAQSAKVTINGLRQDSNQGDRVLVELMDKLGVHTTYTPTGIVLTKKEHQQTIAWDFTHCPDIAQTVAVVCAAKGIEAKLTGLESLRIKETDRIHALQSELKKIHIDALVDGDHTLTIGQPQHLLIDAPVITTYEDHRMAMAFAPLSLLGKVYIEHPAVVEKSYPDFWADLQRLGFTIDEGEAKK